MKHRTVSPAERISKQEEFVSDLVSGVGLDLVAMTGMPDKTIFFDDNARNDWRTRAHGHLADAGVVHVKRNNGFVFVTLKLGTA